jgi:hypothetical protein
MSESTKVILSIKDGRLLARDKERLSRLKTTDGRGTHRSKGSNTRLRWHLVKAKRVQMS